MYHHLVKVAHKQSPPGYLPLAYENDAALYLALTTPEKQLKETILDTSTEVPATHELLRQVLAETGPLISNEVMYAAQMAVGYPRATVYHAAAGTLTTNDEDMGEGPSGIKPNHGSDDDDSMLRVINKMDSTE